MASEACIVCASSEVRRIGADPPLSRCRACGLVLNLRSRDRAAEERLYVESDTVFDTPVSVAEQEYAWLSAGLDIEPGFLFDVGCGTGQFLLVAQQKGWQVAGIELQPASARVAAGRVHGPIATGSFLTSEAPTRPLDVLTFWDVLDHLDDPSFALHLAWQRLAPGGVVLVRVRNILFHLPLHRAYRLAARVVPGLATRRNPAAIHRYGFTVPTLTRLLRETGFTRLEILKPELTVVDRQPSGLAPWLTGALKQLFGRSTSWLADVSGNRLYYCPSIMVRAVRP